MVRIWTTLLPSFITVVCPIRSLPRRKFVAKDGDCQKKKGTTYYLTFAASLYARLKNGRIVLYPLASVRPSVRL